MNKNMDSEELEEVVKDIQEEVVKDLQEQMVEDAQEEVVKDLQDEVVKDLQEEEGRTGILRPQTMIKATPILIDIRSSILTLITLHLMWRFIWVVH